MKKQEKKKVREKPIESKSQMNPMLELLKNLK